MQRIQDKFLEITEGTTKLLVPEKSIKEKVPPKEPAFFNPVAKLNRDFSILAYSAFWENFEKPKIVASTDGVGTKIEIANTLNKYDTIGIDLVAKCENDHIVQGAKPLLFLDYISINKIDSKKLKSIIKGIIKGCNISDCELVGGETAELSLIHI